MLIHWIWLAHRPGLGDRGKGALLQHFSSPEAIYFADETAYRQVPGLSGEAIAGLQDRDLTKAEAILELCREEKIHLLTIQDAAYPSRLKHIPDPPVLLYYKGQLPDFDAYPVIAIVGTRKASAYGLATAKRMGYQIGKCGAVVVSGMAFGIDAMAMAGALTAGQQVVGVLGCGVDVVYPQSNRSLFRDVEQYGCLLSEFPPGTRPAKWNFPKRNRIISGLSNGVLVVEAPETSGALITAHQAAEQGRDVFAVPGNIDLPSFVGSNRLIRDGAIVVSSGWDVLSEYEGLYPDKLHKQPVISAQSPREDGLGRPAQHQAPLPKVAQSAAIPRKDGNLKKTLEKKPIDKEHATAYSDVNKPLPALTAQEQAVVDALASGERLVDDVVAETGLTAGKVLAALTMLEIKGIVRRMPGKRIVLADR